MPSFSLLHSPRRKPSALLCATLLAAGTLGAAACADAPTASTTRTAAPALPLASSTSTSSTGTTTKVTAMLRDVPLASTLTRSWTIKRTTGGTLDWPELGLQVLVPANAFSARELKFTVTALKGDVIAYDFGPDGSQFALPLTVVQSLVGTNFFKLSSSTGVRGAYFRSATQVSDATNTAVVDAFQTTEIDLTKSQALFKVTHFSGYMMSTGLASTDSDSTSTVDY